MIGLRFTISLRWKLVAGEFEATPVRSAGRGKITEVFAETALHLLSRCNHFLVFDGTLHPPQETVPFSVHEGQRVEDIIDLSSDSADGVSRSRTQRLEGYAKVAASKKFEAFD